MFTFLAAPNLLTVASNHATVDPGNLAPRNVCRKGLKLPDIPGNLSWLNCKIILMTINEAYLVALRATVTLTYIPVTGTSDYFGTL